MNTNTKTRTDIHRIDGKIIRSVYGPSLFVAVYISQEEPMRTIEQLSDRLDETYSVENPSPAGERYIATLTSIKIAEQLTRIADALERANAPEVHQVGSGAPDPALAWRGCVRPDLETCAGCDACVMCVEYDSKSEVS